MDTTPYSSGVKASVVIDMERLISDVAQRHDVLLRRDDPILVAVTLNERLVERALARLTAVVEASEARSNAASAEHVEAAKQLAERLITEAARYVASQVREGAQNAVETTKAVVENQLAAAQKIADTKCSLVLPVLAPPITARRSSREREGAVQRQGCSLPLTPSWAWQ